jgi:broad specificity phosphatase PhoE
MMPQGVPKTEITFVRHAESEANAGAATSDPALIPLSALGRRQAEDLSMTWGEPPSLIVVSGYLRTRLTAEPTRRRFPDVPVEQWPVHEFTYLAPARCQSTTATQRRPWVDEYWDLADPAYRDGPGAESFAEFISRVESVSAGLARLDPPYRLLVFTHALWMQAFRLLRIFPAWSLAQRMAAFRRFNADHPLSNAARIRATVESGVIRLLDFPIHRGDAEH